MNNLLYINLYILLFLHSTTFITLSTVDFVRISTVLILKWMKRVFITFYKSYLPEDCFPFLCKCLLMMHHMSSVKSISVTTEGAILLILVPLKTLW